jgi:hypothetical protein
MLTIKKEGLNVLKKYPKDKLVCLIVELKKLKSENGWVKYEEREPGCVEAAFKALAFAITNLENTKLTVDYIKQLQKIFTDGVDVHNVHNVPGQLRNDSKEAVGYVLDKSWVTKEGVKELLEMIAKQNKYKAHHSASIGLRYEFYHNINIYDDRTYYQSSGKEINDELIEKIFSSIQKDENFMYRAPCTWEAFDDHFQNIIDNYNTNIKLAKTNDEKLSVIVEVIYELEHIHPFHEANGRTFEIGLLTRLLLQNGFPPATFEDPNIFEGHSKNELLEGALPVFSMSSTGKII